MVIDTLVGGGGFAFSLVSVIGWENGFWETNTLSGGILKICICKGSHKYGF